MTSDPDSDDALIDRFKRIAAAVGTRTAEEVIDSWQEAGVVRANESIIKRDILHALNLMLPYSFEEQTWLWYKEILVQAAVAASLRYLNLVLEESC